LLKGVLSRIKQKLMNQLISDYCAWANQTTTTTNQQASLSSPKTA